MIDQGGFALYSIKSTFITPRSQMLNEIQLLFADKWVAQLLVSSYIILVPFAIAELALSTFRRYLGAPYHTHFTKIGRVLVFAAWRSFFVCLLDIFIFQTVILSVIAAAVSAAISITIAAYLEYQARSKHGQTFIFKNG